MKTKKNLAETVEALLDCKDASDLLARLPGKNSKRLPEIFDSVVTSLLEEHPDYLVEIAKKRGDLRERILTELLDWEYFDQGYQLDPERTKEKLITYTKKFPIDALEYASRSKHANHKNIINEAIETVINKGDSEKIVQTYNLLCDLDDEDITKRFLDRLDEIQGLSNLDVLGEIYCKALEVTDYEALEIIGREFLDSNPIEVRVLAEEIDDCYLKEMVEEDKDIREIDRYEELINRAHKIIDQVSAEFGGDFPERVVQGGPKGSFATIGYQRYGDE